MDNNIELDNAQALDLLLYQIENSVLTERDKGTQFETLIRTFLSNDQVYRDQFSEIYTASQFAEAYPDYVHDKRDIGVDIYCKNISDGKFTAVQCKFYKENARLDRKGIDSFIAASDREFISARLFITTQNIAPTDNALIEFYADRKVPIQFITRSDLQNSSIDYKAYIKGEVREIEKRQLRPYQESVIKNVLRGFKDTDRGTLVMACGTGKTFTSLRLTERYLAPIGGGVERYYF